MKVFATLLTLLAAGTQGVSATWDPPCDSGSLSGTTLQAGCYNNGLYIDSEIDLNGCIANYNGALACANSGGFGGSCFSCSISGTKLVCRCYDDSGANRPQNIDTNSCVYTDGTGNLACFGHN